MSPGVFIVIGPAGSGKTTVAQQTAKEHEAAYLDKDRVSGRFVEFALTATGHDPTDRESNDYYRDNLLARVRNPHGCGGREPTPRPVSGP